MLSASEMKQKIQYNREMIERIISESVQNVNNIVNDCQDMLDEEVTVNLTESNFITLIKDEFNKLLFSKNASVECPSVTVRFTLYVDQLSKTVVESKLNSLIKRTAKMYNFKQYIGIMNYEIYDTICKRVFHDYTNTYPKKTDNVYKNTTRLLETLYNHPTIKKFEDLGYKVEISYNYSRHKMEVTIAC